MASLFSFSFLTHLFRACEKRSKIGKVQSVDVDQLYFHKWTEHTIYIYEFLPSPGCEPRTLGTVGRWLIHNATVPHHPLFLLSALNAQYKSFWVVAKVQVKCNLNCVDTFKSKYLTHKQILKCLHLTLPCKTLSSADM